MKIKIFKSHVSEVADTNNIESSLNQFIRNKKVISIEQSMVPKIQNSALSKEERLYFVIITVLYEESN